MVFIQISVCNFHFLLNDFDLDSMNNWVLVWSTDIDVFRVRAGTPGLNDGSTDLSYPSISSLY